MRLRFCAFSTRLSSKPRVSPACFYKPLPIDRKAGDESHLIPSCHDVEAQVPGVKRSAKRVFRAGYEEWKASAVNVKPEASRPAGQRLTDHVAAGRQPCHLSKFRPDASLL